MSIKGHPYAWFVAALRRGDMTAVRAAAADLAHVSLADALAICLVMSESDGEPYERAAARWLARLIVERQDVELAGAREVLAALESLPSRPAAARHQLADLSDRYGLTPVIGLHR